MSLYIKAVLCINIAVLGWYFLDISALYGWTILWGLLQGKA